MGSHLFFIFCIMDEKLAMVPVEVSAHHTHLSQEHQDILFGEGYEMTIKKDLSQTGQWATEEKVTVKGPRGELTLRVLGPCRDKTQVELSKTDCVRIGIAFHLGLSGMLKDTAGCTLVGPAGTVELEEGVIVPFRHIHIRDTEAEERGLKNGDIVSVEVGGPRGVVFNEVHVRVRDTFRMALHLDTDEGNAAWVIMFGTEDELKEVTGTIIKED